jgi:predicted AlkP superfamily phosphohydrolase/phosphomutase
MPDRRSVIPGRFRALPTRPVALLFVMAACAATGFGAAACRSPRDARAVPPLVVIGVDGLEGRLLLRMAGQGRLPTLAGMATGGSFVRLSTLKPAISPPIWTTIATGVLPARHGINGFVRRGQPDANGRPVLMTSRDRREKALWNHADDAGLNSCVIGWWTTFPAEQVRGLMVAQTGAPPGDNPDHAHKGSLRSGVSGQVAPTSAEDEVFALAQRGVAALDDRRRQVFGDTASWPPAMQRLAEGSAWSLAADAAYESIALEMAAARGRCDVLLVYLGVADVLGHRFWRWTWPEDYPDPPPADEAALYGGVMERAYEHVDRFVARMREAAGADATLVVMSDHGMGAFHPHQDVDPGAAEVPRTGGHSPACEPVLLAMGGAAAHPAAPRPLPSSFADVPRAGAVADVAPTMLAWMGLDYAAGIDGRPLATVIDAGFAAAHPQRGEASPTPADWQQGRKFVEGDDDAAGQRLEQLRGLGYLE